MAFTALFASSIFTNTEILISDVVIICILIFFSYNASNILAATPGLFAIPTPTIETLDKLKFDLEKQADNLERQPCIKKTHEGFKSSELSPRRQYQTLNDFHYGIV